tara:strand:+ start:1114 stop:1386 length:273 start_codon:yes stop_codon:yes gene_type:complete
LEAYTQLYCRERGMIKFTPEQKRCIQFLFSERGQYITALAFTTAWKKLEDLNIQDRPIDDIEDLEYVMNTLYPILSTVIKIRDASFDNNL